jgi:hypothetical protein
MQRNDQFQTAIRDALRAFDVQTIRHDSHNAAAVAVAITDEGLGADLPGLP